jgi:GINS complex subunit 2
LQPPHRNNIPLWLALLLKKQKRASISPPPWLHPHSLALVLEFETEHSKEAFSPPPKLPPSSSGNNTTSPPFLLSSTVEAQPDALPYHWLELGEMLLQAAPDDFEEVDQVRRLMRDLREVRMAKLRAGIDELDAAGGVRLNGVGGMELSEGRGFIGGVIDGLRRINASKEQARRERQTEEQENGFAGAGEDYEDML